MANVKIDNLADEIMNGLKEYADLATDDLKNSVRKAGNTVRKDIAASAPKDTGAYAKSWSVKKTKETSNSLELTVNIGNRNCKSTWRYVMEELLQIIKEMGIPFAYDHFAEGESPDPPFICYLLPGSDNFAADGRVYLKVNEVHIELYTDLKDLSVEQKVESVLDSHGIFYDRLETWIESEKMYEVLYSFEMEA